MGSIRATEIKRGQTLVFDGELFVVVKRDHVTPGKGHAMHHVQLRNVRSGAQKNLRLATSETVEVAYLDTKSCQYLYKDSTGYVFMDEESFEQFPLAESVVRELMCFIADNQVVQVTFHDGEAVSIDLPTSVVLAVTEAEEAVRGNTATNVTKNATVETGLVVKVPLHIKAGEKIKVNTQDKSFVGRAND